MTSADLEKHLFDMVDIRPISTRDFNADTFLLGGSPGRVDDLGVAHNSVGHCDFNVITSQEARTAYPDMGDLSPFSTIENDKVANLVWRIGQDEYTSEEICDGILGTETDRDTDDSS